MVLSLDHPNHKPQVWPQIWVSVLLVLPWVHAWAPSPQSNTLPVLISWACLCLLALSDQMPSPLAVARAWTWAALISSAMGLVQYFGVADSFGGVVHVPAYLGDAVGNLRQRNQLATLTSMGVVAVLWWQAQGLRSRHAGWMLALLAVGNAATGSRTGLLELVLVTLLCVAWSLRHGSATVRLSWRWSLATLAVCLLASALLPKALSAITAQDVAGAVTRMGHDEGCGSRRVLWGNVLHLISLHPWAGWGWGELKYAHYITPYPGERFCDILGNAHNLPLHLAVELGVPAAVGLVGAMLAVAWRLRPWRIERPEQALAWGVLAVVGLHSLLEYPLWYGPFQVATLLCGLMLWPAWPSVSRRWSQVVQLIGLGALVLALLVAADYWRMRQIYLPSAERFAPWRANPWDASRHTVFFEPAYRFAQLTTTQVSAGNAIWVLDASLDMLHYSPEPRIVQAVIDSARLLGRDDLVTLHQERMQQAFPTAASSAQ
jgi:O-antigen ligase